MSLTLQPHQYDRTQEESARRICDLQRHIGGSGKPLVDLASESSRSVFGRNWHLSQTQKEVGFPTGRQAFLLVGREATVCDIAFEDGLIGT